MNIGKILNRATKELRSVSIGTADLDARILLSEVLKKGTTYLYSYPQALITNSDYQKFRRYIRRRKKGEPVAYIIGEKEFHGYTFKVNKNVLIPRPESELIVKETIDFLKCHCDESAKKQSRLPRSARNDNEQAFNIIDVGTGSGCIIISLIKEIQKTIIHDSLFMIHAYATDLSEKALRVAKANIKSMNLYDNIILYKSDLLSNPRIPKKLDVIIANLPYIPDNHPGIDHKSLAFEPKTALYGGSKGYKLIEKLFEQIKNKNLYPKLILVEIFEDYAVELLNIAKRIFPHYRIEILKDLVGLNRVLKISNPISVNSAK